MEESAFEENNSPLLLHDHITFLSASIAYHKISKKSPRANLGKPDVAKPQQRYD